MDQVLRTLLTSKEFISGEIIAEKLGISRTAVWKHIAQIKKMGFGVNSAPRKGYLITNFPENRIIPELIEFYSNKEIPYELIVMDTVDSTNTMAKKMVMEENKDNFVLLAEEQRSGRGRMARQWISRKGEDLTFTLVLKLRETVADFYRYTLATSLSIHEELSQLLKDDGLIIKWPNDLYFKNKKICGILSEMITEGMTITSIIIGIGINVNSKPVMETATTLAELLSMNIDRNRLLSLLLNRIKSNLDELKIGNYPILYQRWKERMGWIGKKIRLNTGGVIVDGTLLSVGVDGTILIDTNEGKKSFYSGDLLL